MFGDNPKRMPINDDGRFLYVQSIFKTIQGEGPNVGMPSIFIRLGGCNLACEFCDTEFENFQKQNIEDILRQVNSLMQTDVKQKFQWLIVITGGEPFRQSIELLCSKLISLGLKVQIETNGTLFRPALHPNVEIICSPKIINNKYHMLRDDLLQRIVALKFLISAHIKGYDIVCDIGQNKYNIPVFLQPMDEYNKQKNHQNERLALKLALENGYRLSMQIHKILDIE